jgi:hypothetical protein
VCVCDRTGSNQSAVLCFAIKSIATIVFKWIVCLFACDMGFFGAKVQFFDKVSWVLVSDTV